MRVFCLLILFTVFAACAEVQKAADGVARASARAAVDEVLVTRFPNVDGARVTPYTDCVIDNASGREIASLARAALVGVEPDTVSLVVDIAGRPETAACLIKAGFNPLSAGGSA